MISYTHYWIQISDSPSLPWTWCIAFILAYKIKNMTKCDVIGKLTDLLDINYMKKVNSASVSRVVIGIYLFISYFLSWLSQRLIIIKINTIKRLKIQEKFFCFECGMYLSQEDMSISVAGWFGVCRLCNEACDHFTQFRNKF